MTNSDSLDTSATTLTFSIPITSHIVINGFKMNDVIMDVLNQYTDIRGKHEIADSIEKEFCIKMYLKQGGVNE